MKIDFHTHILPCTDDGSRSIEESLQMLRLEKEQGTDIVVATPHFYPQKDRPEKFLQRRNMARQKIMDSIASGDGIPQIILGAEVYYFNGISDWSGLRDLSIGNTDYILLEMPMEKWTDRMYEEIDGIYTKQGLIPVIAHLDRYINIFNANGIIKRLTGMKVVIQANSSFFTDRKSRKFALKLLENDVINILGSDCHNMRSRKPDLMRAEEIIMQKLGREYINNINMTGEKILSEK